MNDVIFVLNQTHAIKSFLLDNKGMAIALMVGGGLFLVLIVKTILGRESVHSDKIALCACVLLSMAYYLRPQPPVPPVKVVEVVKQPWIKLPEQVAITLPELPKLPEWPEFNWPESPKESAEEIAAREKAEAEALAAREREELTALAQAERDRKARIRQENLAVIRYNNRVAEAQINNYIGQGISYAEAIGQWELHQMNRERQALMGRGPLMTLPPGSVMRPFR